MNVKIIFLVLPFVLMAGCTNQKDKANPVGSLKMHEPDSIALRLNNKAARLMGDASHYDDSVNNLLLDSAIIYLDQAIERDCLYLLAYTNKAQALQRKGSLQEALQVLNEVETIKPDFAEVLMGQGFLLEKMGKMSLADQKYRQAFKAYEKRLENDPGNDKVKSDIAFLYIFLEDKNSAIDEIQNLVLEDPESEQLKMMEGVIKNFDRKKFIDQY